MVLIRLLSAKTTNFPFMMLFHPTQALRTCIRYWTLHWISWMVDKQIENCDIILQSFKTLLITWLFQVVCVRQMRPECPPRWQSESPKSSLHLSSKISSRISSRITSSSASLHPPRNYKKPCIHWLFSLFSSDSDFVAGSETLRTLSRVVVECWHHSPPVRLTALRVKKTLAR